jgi:hypothetical protein
MHTLRHPFQRHANFRPGSVKKKDPYQHYASWFWIPQSRRSGERDCAAGQ